MKNFLFIILFLLCITIFADTLGPTSEMYVVKWQNAGIAVIQGSNIVRSWSTGANGEIAIAVTSDRVRTIGHTTSYIGAEYTLQGTFTGTQYTTLHTYHHDGTSDGQYNYGIVWNTGNVYRYGLNWQNPEYLFNAGSNALGITYDTSNNSLWVSSWGYGTVSNFSMTGSLLSSFTARTASNSALAMDYADGTLWMSESASGTFSQYTKAGTYLGSKTYAVTNMWGAEFSVAVPEPSTGILVSLILALAAFLKKK
ncbi:MAG: PEP-CTERM sorting domain-containing protein [Candidatus Brocadiae bacterium]|nr:PEP-CTERM sorting domain-containing protein [Candidatus Brocadiia bacterium]